MNEIELQIFCKKNENKNHDFELTFLESLDVHYQCKNCDYEFLDIVEKPEWLLEQLKNEKKNI